MPTIVGSIHANQEYAFEIHRRVMLLHADQGNVASWLHLLRLVVAVQLANQCGAILGSFVRHCGNEGFDQISAGIAESFGSAEISCVALHERGIEFVLSNQQAELVAKSGLAIAEPFPFE